MPHASDDEIGRAGAHMTPIASELDGGEEQCRSRLDWGRKGHETQFRSVFESTHRRHGSYIRLRAGDELCCAKVHRDVLCCFALSRHLLRLGLRMIRNYFV